LRDLEEEIVAAIRRIVRAVDLHSRWLVARYELTGPQLATLRAAARLGSPTAGTLARAVNLSQATLTGILDRLERRGLVRRLRGGTDRRTVRIEVTARGLAVLDRAPSLLHEGFRRQLAGLAEWEQLLILSTLQRIGAMMESEVVRASPELTTGGAPSEEVLPPSPAGLALTDARTPVPEAADGPQSVAMPILPAEQEAGPAGATNVPSAGPTEPGSDE